MQSQTLVHINHIHDECWSAHKLSISSERASKELLASRNHDMHVLFLPRGRVTRPGTVCKLPAVISQRLLGSYHHRTYAEPVTYNYLSKLIYICTISPDEAEYADVLPIKRVSAMSYLCLLRSSRYSRRLNCVDEWNNNIWIQSLYVIPYHVSFLLFRSGPYVLYFIQH